MILVNRMICVIEYDMGPILSMNCRFRITNIYIAEAKFGTAAIGFFDTVYERSKK